MAQNQKISRVLNIRRAISTTEAHLSENCRPSCIDLFAGAGGLAEGFRQAGWKILCAIDNDRHAAKTFRINFPKTRFYEEKVEHLEPGKLLGDIGLRRGELDCLIGGPPCQSFSYNNHARSANGRRAQLFRHYLRIVETLYPKMLVMENVPGMLTIGNGKIVNEIRHDLGKLGYTVNIRILYAEDYGIPQQRRRVFIIGTRLGWEESLFPMGTHGPSPKPATQSHNYVHIWKPEKKRSLQPLVTVWDAIGDLPPVRNGNPRNISRYSKMPLTKFQKYARRGCVVLYNHIPHRLSRKMLLRVRTIPEGGDWRDLPRRLLPAGMKRARRNDHTKRYGRLSRKGLCCTILTKCDPHWGSYIHPLADRTITVREAARLQSFPDRFLFGEAVSKAYEQIGNAVPPVLAKHIAHALEKHLQRKPNANKPINIKRH